MCVGKKMVDQYFLQEKRGIKICSQIESAFDLSPYPNLIESADSIRTRTVYKLAWGFVGFCLKVKENNSAVFFSVKCLAFKDQVGTY